MHRASLRASIAARARERFVHGGQNIFSRNLISWTRKITAPSGRARKKRGLRNGLIRAAIT